MDHRAEIELLSPVERARRVWVRNKAFFRLIMRGRGAASMAIGFYDGIYYTQYRRDFQEIELALVARGFTNEELDDVFHFVYL